MNYLFAGDRDIGVRVLTHLLEEGYKPSALLLPDPAGASHSARLREIAGLPESHILLGGDLSRPEAVSQMRALEPDYLIAVHYPHLIPGNVLEIPKEAALNLHPAWLPYNRGWHTPSWAILEGTPAGATLHVMSEKTDGGDIVHRLRVDIDPADTADSLYQKLKNAEFSLFCELLPALVRKEYNRLPQPDNQGTFHKKEDLSGSSVQEIDLDGTYSGRELLDKLRALTTNDVSEAACFQRDGRRFRVQVSITEEENEQKE
ncbi:MAG: formyltransferase family protein [Balneolaceae bacterium]